MDQVSGQRRQVPPTGYGKPFEGSRVRFLAFLLGGGIALTSHGTKAAARLTVNASPEPFSNIALSALEDAGSVGLYLLTAFHPVVTLVSVTAFVVFGLLLVRKLFFG